MSVSQRKFLAAFFLLPLNKRTKLEHISWYTYLNVKVVSGRYDLCDNFSLIGIPQKSFFSRSSKEFVPSTSRFITIAGKSSCTKSPDNVLR